MKSIRTTIKWLGPQRAQLFFLLLAITGLISLILNAVGQAQAWVRVVQSFLLIAFMVGATVIIVTRFPPQDRRQLRIALTPALLAISLGLLFTNYIAYFTLAAIGWLFIALFIIRGRVRQEYQVAIKYMRNNEYDEAIKVMSGLIKEEPDKADHRRFRAELYRLSGKIKRARGDYEKVVELTPESGVGYNGLAEVYLQDGEFQEALGYAQKALELEPDHWVAPYNLGMIEDRLEMSQQALVHLQQADKTGIPDSRHRLLTHLWMARAYARQGQSPDAEKQILLMRNEQDGLQEWQTIFESEAAAVLRGVLEEDVNLAGQLVKKETSVEALTTAS